MTGHPGNTGVEGGGGRAWRIAVSVGIGACLVMQAIAGFRLVCPPKSLAPSLSWLRVCAPSLWPFLDYDMYATPHHAGEAINQFRVFGRLEDGTEVPILPPDLRLDPYEFIRTFSGPLRDATEESA